MTALNEDTNIIIILYIYVLHWIIKHVVPTNQSDCLKHLSSRAYNNGICTLGQSACISLRTRRLQRWIHFLVYKLPSEPKGGLLHVGEINSSIYGKSGQRNIICVFVMDCPTVWKHFDVFVWLVTVL